MKVLKTWDMWCMYFSAAFWSLSEGWGFPSYKIRCFIQTVQTNRNLSGKGTTWDSNQPSHPGMDLDFPIHAQILDSETFRGQMMLWIQRCL